MVLVVGNFAYLLKELVRSDRTSSEAVPQLFFSPKILLIFYLKHNLPLFTPVLEWGDVLSGYNTFSIAPNQHFPFFHKTRVFPL